MNDRHRIARCTLVRMPALLLAPLLLVIGCTASGGDLSIVSFADPYFPETIQIDMGRAVYRIDRTGDIHLACHSDPGGAAQPEDTTAWLQAHIYWHPKPGKTHDDPTAADATIRYLMLTSHGARLYSGSAFVFPEIDRRSGRLTARIERARLQPVATEGQAPESLGEARISGVVRARNDQAATIDLIGEMNRAAPRRE